MDASLLIGISNDLLPPKNREYRLAALSVDYDWVSKKLCIDSFLISVNFAKFGGSFPYKLKLEIQLSAVLPYNIKWVIPSSQHQPGS